MTCAACEKRQAQEQRQLSDCESRCKEMSIKNQRLSLALAVVGTLVGKESLDFALGLSSTLGQIAAVTTDDTMDFAGVEVTVSQGQETDRGGLEKQSGLLGRCSKPVVRRLACFYSDAQGARSIFV